MDIVAEREKLTSKLVSRAILNCTIGVLGFAAAAALLDSFMRPIAVKEVTAKFAYFIKHPKRYDTLFIGSSHILTHIDPKLFDEENRGRGMDTRTYNFGVGAMSLEETDYMLDRILPRLRKGNLKYVMLELGGSRLDLPLLWKDTNREVFWHDFRRTADVSRELWDEQLRLLRFSDWIKVRPELHALELIAMHWVIFLKRETHIGQAAEWIGMWRGEKAPDAPDFIPTKEGYYTLLGKISSNDSQLIREAKIKRGVVQPQFSGFMSAAASTERVIEKLRAKGVSPIFFVSPDIAFGRERLQKLVETSHIPVLRFDDPDRYPELYEDKYRSDSTHLNATGASIFTRLFSREFVEALKRSSIQPETRP